MFLDIIQVHEFGHYLMYSRLFFALALVIVSWPAVALPDEAASIAAALSATADDGTARRFYLRQGESLAWSGGEEEKANAGLALAVLANAASDGLDPERYRVLRSGGDIAADDVALSEALLTYMRDLALGRPDLEAVDADVALPQQSFDPVQVLDEALRKHRLAAMLATLAPPYSEYAALKAELAHDPRWTECAVDHGQHGTLALDAARAGDRPNSHQRRRRLIAVVAWGTSWF